MTVPIRVKKKCCMCGHSSTQTALASTNRFGAPDLDTRPPEMMRSTMGWWIEECPACGYVSSDISKKTQAITKNMLTSEKYKSCNGRAFKTDLGEKFYKAFLIHVHAKQWEESFLDVLHAAWACDDAYDRDNAIVCRKLAIKCLEELHSDNDTLKAIKADLLRRAGLFGHVVTEYEHFQCSDEMLNRIIRFEVNKARKRDTGCYTLDDIGE